MFALAFGFVAMNAQEAASMQQAAPASAKAQKAPTKAKVMSKAEQEKFIKDVTGKRDAAKTAAQRAKYQSILDNKETYFTNPKKN